MGRHNAHDTSRHTERAKVTCHYCGRILSGALNLRGKWTVRKHKAPDGTACWGDRNTDHRPVVTETTPE